MLTRYYDSVLKNYYGDTLDSFKIFDKTFDEFYAQKTYHDKSSVYRVEIEEHRLTLSIDVPGVKPEDISCNVVDREVRVTGKCRGEEFKYLYTISRQYDTSSPEANLENGVLSLHFKKFDAASKSVKINVK